MTKILATSVLLVVLAIEAQAAITATNKGTGTESAANTTVNVAAALTGTLNAGKTGILCLMTDNAGGASTSLGAVNSKITDSAGNDWYMRKSLTDGGQNLQTEGAFYTSNLTANLTSAGTLTITFSNTTTAKAWAFIEASSGLTSGAVLVVPSKPSFTVAQAATAAPTGNSNLACVGDLVVGLGGAEAADTFNADDTDTSNGSWTASQHAGVGSGAAGMSIITQTKVVTAYATQTYNVGLSGVADCRIGTMILSEVDAKTRSLFEGATVEATTNIGVGLPIAAGSIGVLALSLDNAFTAGAVGCAPTTLTDTQSNTWTRQVNTVVDPGSANAGAEIAIYTSVLTTALAATDTVGCTWLTQPTAKAAVIMEFAPASAGTMSFVNGAAGNNSGASPTTAPTLTSSSITNADWIVAMTGAEADDNLTQDSTSTNGAWRPQSAIGRSTGATAIFAATQAKLVTATATQTYAATFGASSDWATGWVAVHETVPVSAITKLPAVPAIPGIPSL